MTFFKRGCRALRLWGCIFLIASYAAPTLAKPPVESFARLPQFTDVSLSPDGKKLAALYLVQGIYTFITLDVSTRDVKVLYQAKTDDDISVRWINWVSNTRLLVSVGAAKRRHGVPVTETRLLAMNYDGSKPLNMMRRKRSKMQMARPGRGGGSSAQIQDHIVSFLPHDPDHVLMAYNEDDVRKPRVYRVNVHNARDSVVQGGQKEIYNWYTDRQGQVRIGWGRSDTAWRYIIRNSKNDNWRTLKSSAIGSTTDFGIFGFSNNPNILYVRSNHEGGPSAIYEYNVSAGRFGKRVFAHPEVDAGSIWWNKKTYTPRRISYVLDGPHYQWMDTVARAEFKSLGKALPGLTLSIVETSEDDNVWVLYGGSVTKPGGYYIYNRRQRSVSYLSSNFPELEKTTLSPMHNVQYQARDGLTIPAYITLPPSYTDLNQAQNLPFVVMPHGGPASRDTLSFDIFAQHLAAQGYGVLQMNFRGSWGYGAAFEAAGNGEWGGKMQDDVTDGVAYLTSNGFADPRRICIVGGSYGGYAALMGAVKTPDLYKCAVGLNGVYDLRKLMRDDFRFVGNGGAPYWQAVIGDYSNKAFLESISPAKNAQKIKIPILLAATEDDRVVRESQSGDMASALKRAGVSYQYLKMENGGHSVWDSKSRLSYMRTLENFLAKHLK